MSSPDESESAASPSGRPEDASELLTNGTSEELRAETEAIDGHGHAEKDGPDAVVVYLPGARALVLSEDVSDAAPTIWGRLVAQITNSELSSVVRSLDPLTQALIKAKQMTGHLVELHPTDIKMLKEGAQTVTEDGGWIQGTLRDKGRYARVMRIRPGGATTAMASGSLMLAAIAAQAQAEAIARDIKAIRQRVEDLHQYLRDEQIGAAASVVDQVEALVEVLRQHGNEGVDASEFSVIRNSLGDARAKCLQHLKTSLHKLEGASAKGVTLHDAETNIASQEAVDEVLAYVAQLDELRRATVQFGLAQAAFDYQEGRDGVAQTRLSQLKTTVEQLGAEIDDAWARIGEVGQKIRERSHLKSVAGRASKNIGTKVLFGLGAGVVLPAAAAAAPAAGAIANGGGKAGSTSDSSDGVKKALAFGAAAVGGVGGLVVGSRDLVHDVRSRKPLEHRIGQIERAREQLQGAEDISVPSLEWLSQLRAELPTADEAS